MGRLGEGGKTPSGWMNDISGEAESFYYAIGVNSMFFQIFAFFSWSFQRKIVNLPSDINYLNILPWVNILTPSPIGASNASSDKNSARTC